MDSLGKMLLVAGALIAAAGLFILLAGKVPFLGRLPGDIRREGKNYGFYMPVATCLLISGIVSLILWMVSKFRS